MKTQNKDSSKDFSTFLTQAFKDFWKLFVILVVLGFVIAWVSYNSESPHVKVEAGFIFSSDFSADGKTLTTVGVNGVQVWSVPDLKLVQDRGFEGGFYTFSTLLTPNKQVVFTTERKEAGDTIKAWEVNKKTQLYSLTGYSVGVGSISFNQAQGLFSVIPARKNPSDKKVVEIRQITDGKLVKTINDASGLIFSPRGDIAASRGDFEVAAKLWRVSDGSLLKTLASSEKIIGGVGPLAFSPDGKYVAISIIYNKNKRGLQLWRVSDGNLVWSLDNLEDVASSIAFSPDGQIIAIGHDLYPDREFGKLQDKAIHLRQTSNGDLVSRLVGHSDEVFSVQFSPDGKYLVSSSFDETMRLWQIK